MPETNARIKVCHDTAANFKTNNPTLLVGEWALETDTKKMKIGDGSTAYNALPYSTAEDSDEWRKPDDWIDIRSGAIDNSIYFLVGHSVDYSTYNMFPITCSVSNSGTFDVFIDGFKIATASNDYHINWQELALDTGFDITYPETLRAHIVRITPTLNTNKFTQVRAIYTGAGYTDVGLLWAHFEIDYEISLYMFASTFSTQRANKLEAITAKGDLLKLSSCYHSFYRCYRLKKTPVFDCTNVSSSTGFFANCESIKNIKLKNFTSTSAGSLFAGCISLTKIESEGSKFSPSNAFNTCYSLQQIPPLLIDNTEVLGFAMGSGLKDTYLDLSQYTKTTKLNAPGTVSYKMLGLKSVTVSNEAPFNNATSPQIDVRYTGLSRAALVNLFKSMPYNVGYNVVGSPTIVDGVAIGFSSSNYLSTISLSNHIPFEYVVCFTPNTVVGTGNGIGVARIGDAKFLINSSSHLMVMYSDGSNQWITESETTLVSNIKYWGKLTYDGTYVKLQVSTDGENYTTGTTQEKNPRNNTTVVRFGYLYDQFVEYDGSIDLNNTYIKVNGATWFNGAATRQLDPAATNVGGVTITNGVASGFSSSKYVNIPGTFSLNQDFEMRADFTTAASFTNNGTILAGPLAYRGGFCIDSKNLRFQGRYVVGSDAYQYILSFDTVISASTNYVAKAVRNSNTLTITLYVNGVLTETKTGDLTDINFSTISAFVIGSGGNGDFNGSVNLNNTYVIINNVKVFSGMVPMTKTCSVVGCTGTADLTADDKAIATGKGWELTVA